MNLHRPDLAEVTALAAELGLQLGPAQAAELHTIVNRLLDPYEHLATLPELEAPERFPRGAGSPPEPAENALGAWRWRTNIAGAPDGPLAGVTIAIKDNIGVAGIPLTHGTDLLDGYRPERDATVVERVLDAGATILGTATCEAFCLSGGSHTGATGPVRNPYDPTRSSGGSSSGAAALVAAGEVDMSIGSDQGGSIRGPSSWCGVYGIKPTFGLVPYTGAIPGEMTLDHLGPIAREVTKLAALLSVLAGPDGEDPRQPTESRDADYLAALEPDLSGVRIGMVREGFDRPSLSEPDVDEAVRAAIWRLTELGAQVVEMSVPWHVHALAVRAAILNEGTASLVLDGLGIGTNWRGRYPTGFAARLGRAFAERPEAIPHTLLTQILAGRWMRQVGHGEVYARAQNLAARVTAEYDAALTACDLLAMPTVPLKPAPLPSPDAPLLERMRLARLTGANTSPFNVSGHPAISLPCALADGLPVGLMLVARRWEDALLLRAGYAFEQQLFTAPPPPVSSAPNATFLKFGR